MYGHSPLLEEYPTSVLPLTKCVPTDFPPGQWTRCDRETGAHPWLPLTIITAMRTEQPVTILPPGKMAGCSLRARGHNARLLIERLGTVGNYTSKGVRTEQPSLEPDQLLQSSHSHLIFITRRLLSVSFNSCSRRMGTAITKAMRSNLDS